MSKPSAKEIATALGISAGQVSQLSCRGMPVNKIKSARRWFECNGFDNIHHGKSGGAASQGPNLVKQANLVKSCGLSKIPPASKV